MAAINSTSTTSSAQEKVKKPSAVERRLQSITMVLEKLRAEAERRNIPFNLDAIALSDDGMKSANEEHMAVEIGVCESRDAIVSQIHHAIDRARNGVFGVCEECYKKIPMYRLNSIAWATTCTPCAKSLESEPVQTRQWDPTATSTKKRDKPLTAEEVEALL